MQENTNTAFFPLQRILSDDSGLCFSFEAATRKLYYSISKRLLHYVFLTYFKRQSISEQGSKRAAQRRSTSLLLLMTAVKWSDGLAGCQTAEERRRQQKMVWESKGVRGFPLSLLRNLVFFNRKGMRYLVV